MDSTSSASSPLAASLTKMKNYNLQTYVTDLAEKYKHLKDDEFNLTTEELKNLKMLFDEHQIILNKFLKI
jgi:hypothetical protein